MARVVYFNPAGIGDLLACARVIVGSPGGGPR
jgi:hypothetical protein